MVDKAGASFVRAGSTSSKAGPPSANPGATPPPLPAAAPRQVDPDPPEQKRLGVATPLSPADARTPAAPRAAPDPSSASRARDLFRSLADLSKVRTQPDRLVQLVDRLVARAAEKSLDEHDDVLAMAEGLCQGLLEGATGSLSDANLIRLLDAVFARAHKLKPDQLGLLVSEVACALGGKTITPKRLGTLMDCLMLGALGKVAPKEMARAVSGVGMVLGGRSISPAHSALMFDRLARCPVDDEKMFWMLTGHWSIQLDMGKPGGSLEAVRSHFSHFARTGPHGTESLYRTGLALLGPLPDKDLDSISQRRANLEAIMDGIEATVPAMTPQQAQHLLDGFLLSLRSSRMALPLERGIILQRMTDLLPRLPPPHAANMAASLIGLFYPAPTDGRPGWPQFLEALVHVMARQTPAGYEALLRQLSMSIPVVLDDERRGDEAMSQLYEIARKRALAEARRSDPTLATDGLKLGRTVCLAQLHWHSREQPAQSGAPASKNGKPETPGQQAWSDRLQELYGQWTAAGRTAVARAAPGLQLDRVERQIEALQSEMQSLEEALPPRIAQWVAGDLLMPIGHLLEESAELARREGKNRNTGGF